MKTKLFIFLLILLFPLITHASGVQEIEAHLHTNKNSLYIIDQNGDLINMNEDSKIIIPGIEYIQQHDFYILYNEDLFKNNGYSFYVKPDSNKEKKFIVYNHELQEEISFLIPQNDKGIAFNVEKDVLILLDDNKSEGTKKIEAEKIQKMPFKQEIVISKSGKEGMSKQKLFLLVISNILIVIGLVFLVKKFLKHTR